MGFIKNQEKKMAVRLLEWKYEKLNTHIPSRDQLNSMAEEIVDEAHTIAKNRGANILSIMKDLVLGVKKQ